MPSFPTNAKQFSSLLIASLLLATPLAALCATADSPIPECPTPGAKPSAPKNTYEVIRYVAASSVAMRTAAAGESELLAYLPIATPLHVTCQQNQWLRGWAPKVRGLIGWVRADLTQENEPSLNSLQNEYKATPASEKAKRRQLAERAVALAPLEAASHKMLIEALTAAGDLASLEKAKARQDAVINPKVQRLAGEPQLIFILDNGMMSPLASINNGKLSNAELAGEETEAKFSSRYFAPGRAYHYYSNGVKAGIAQVNRREEVSCESLQASVSLTGDAKATEAYGILSNVELSKETMPPAPAISEEQKNILLGFARSALQSKKLSAKQITQVLTAKDGDDKSRVFAAIADKGSRYPILVTTMYQDISPKAAANSSNPPFLGIALSIIAEADEQGKYRVSYSDIKLADSEEGFAKNSYLTNMDLTQDGHPELIFIDYGYESWGYSVWGKSKGKWLTLASGGGGGC